MNSREKAATRLARYERMPKWLSKSIALFILLMVGGLFLNGGALLAASFMHVLIGSVDMPPSTVYQTGKQEIPAVDQKPEPYVVTPRKTLAGNMDQVLISLHNPADSYIQSDAVDVGVLLGQSLHQALTSLYAEATRQNLGQVVPPGVPITQGQ